MIIEEELRPYAEYLFNTVDFEIKHWKGVQSIIVKAKFVLRKFVLRKMFYNNNKLIHHKSLSRSSVFR